VDRQKQRHPPSQQSFLRMQKMIGWCSSKYHVCGHEQNRTELKRELRWLILPCLLLPSLPNSLPPYIPHSFPPFLFLPLSFFFSLSFPLSPSLLPSLPVFLSCLLTGSCYVAQAVLKLIILLPQSSECWDYKHVYPHLVSG
jgi:hypothetical protein